MTSVYVSAYKQGWAYLVTTKMGYYGTRGYVESLTDERYTCHAHAIRDILKEFTGSITIVTDSKYVIKLFKEWLSKWKSRDFHDSRGHVIENDLLFREIDQLMSDRKIYIEHKAKRKSDRLKSELEKQAYTASLNLPGTFKGK